MDATPAEAAELTEAVREADDVRLVRARRDAALTPAERLARVHELCRQLSLIEPAADPDR